MSEKRSYAFTLKGEGVDFTGAVTQPVARSILDIILGKVPSNPSSAQIDFGQEVKGKAVGSLRISLREFLNAQEAKRIPEKIVSIGEYMAANGAADFSKDDVLAQFRIAREAMPGNFNRDFNWAVATGWIAEDGLNPGRFYVTQSGKNAVSQKFSSEITKNSGFRSLRRKRRRS